MVLFNSKTRNRTRLSIVAVVALALILITWVNKSGFFGGVLGRIGGWITSHIL